MIVYEGENKIFFCDFCQVSSNNPHIAANPEANMIYHPKRNTVICYDCAALCVHIMDEHDQREEGAA